MSGLIEQTSLPLDVTKVKTPAYVLEEAKLKANLRVLARVQAESGAKIILALKGFAFWGAFPWVREVLHGATSSSLHELLLAKEEMQKECHIYSVAFSDEEFAEVVKVADHIVFNSFSQWQRFRSSVELAEINQSGRKIECGIRVNPEYSEIETELYNPCAANSRLGVTFEKFKPELLQGISGLHFHTHCENNSDALERGIAAFENKFGEYIPQMKWINFGGGHHITRADYDVERLICIIKKFRERWGKEVYLEPGEAVGWKTGPLVASVLDIVNNGMDIAILDTSATAHMPDCLEMPYRPDIQNSGLPGVKPFTYRLGGLTCLAGDVIGDYSFAEQLKIGDKLVFEDMIHYTIVKNSTFNGVKLPSLCIWTEKGELQVMREFGYEVYKYRNG